VWVGDLIDLDRHFLTLGKAAAIQEDEDLIREFIALMPINLQPRARLGERFGVGGIVALDSPTTICMFDTIVGPERNISFGKAHGAIGRCRGTFAMVCIRDVVHMLGWPYWLCRDAAGSELVAEVSHSSNWPGRLSLWGL
jgi:hypothetical protein